MSETVVLALITTIVPTIAALTAAWIAVRNGRIADKKLDEIHGVANSTLSAANARNIELEKMIETLLDEKVVASEQRAAIADVKVVVAEQKTVIAEQKSVISEQRGVVDEQNGQLDGGR